jgi:hypothetical protein
MSKIQVLNFREHPQAFERFYRMIRKKREEGGTDGLALLSTLLTL